ncbi:MAG: hypothetical protein KF823_04545 [Xanthomonadales bacterium]|nr:hypothetical protein [Xanthomonadales bacterium]
MASCGRPDCCLQPTGAPPVSGLLAAFAAPMGGLLAGAGLAAWAGLPAGLAALSALAGMLLATALAGARQRRAHAPHDMIAP